MAEKTDEEIALSVQKGDIQAFGVLVERYEAKLLRYAGRFIYEKNDARDAVQDVFLKAYAGIQGFDSKRKFSSWIYRIAHNKFVNVIRDRGREPLSFFDPDTIFPHPAAPEMADDNLKRRDARETVEKYLNKLDPKYREPLALYYFEDMDYRQISEIMHIPVSTAGIRIKRAREILQKYHQDSKSDNFK